MNNNQSRSAQKDILKVLGLAALLSFVFKLWIIFILLFLAAIIITILMFFLKLKKQGKENNVLKQEPEKTEFQSDSETAYKAILEKISELVHNEYPEAKWIWAQADTQRRIKNCDEVLILLNRSGGYRRAKVMMVDDQVSEIEFLTAKTETVQNESADTLPDNNSVNEELPENYELLAFEWVEAHIMELNERCNEAIGQGIMEFLLIADELPVSESWPSLCEELKRAGLNEAECVTGGIKIKFLQ